MLTLDGIWVRHWPEKAGRPGGKGQHKHGARLPDCSQCDWLRALDSSGVSVQESPSRNQGPLQLDQSPFFFHAAAVGSVSASDRDIPCWGWSWAPLEVCRDAKAFKDRQAAAFAAVQLVTMSLDLFETVSNTNVRSACRLPAMGGCPNLYSLLQVSWSACSSHCSTPYRIPYDDLIAHTVMVHCAESATMAA